MARKGNKVTLDATKFNEAMKQLAKITGVSFDKVIDHEVKKILEKSVRGTKAARAKYIEERFTLLEGQKPSERLLGRITINGKRRNVASIKPTIKRGGKTIRNPDWIILQNKLKQKLAYVKSMRGLAKATWLKQARDLGINIDAPGYVQKAYSRIGTAAARTYGKRTTKRKNYVVTLKNAARVPMVRDVQGYGAFKRALNGRQKYFETNLAKGVFKKSEKITEKYGFEVEDLRL